jgi:N-acetylmuramoyl-L-alanine amidase
LKTLVRPKLRYLLTTAVAIACVYVAAPALSAQPYRPGGVDFVQPLGAVERTAGKTGGGFISAKLDAPKHFDLAGLAREMRPYELRARSDGGKWTEWVEAADGNPVYFGGADQLQLRTHGFRPKGKVHYVNVSGTSTPAQGLLTGAREVINSAFISASTLVGGEAAEALPPRPKVVGRGAWGANLAKGGCRPRTGAVKGTVKAAVIHHTATANDYSAAEAPDVVLGICRYHRNANGWNDIGYNALVDRFGTLYAGRRGGLRKAIVGAHAQGFNATTTSIASIGDHTDTQITPQARASIIEYVAWKLSAHGLSAIGKTTVTSAGGDLSRYPAGRKVRLKRVVGHRDVGLTACPGESLQLDIRSIRRMVQARITEYGGPAPPAPPTDPTDPAAPPGGGVSP